MPNPNRAPRISGKGSSPDANGASPNEDFTVTEKSLDAIVANPPLGTMRIDGKRMSGGILTRSKRRLLKAAEKAKKLGFIAKVVRVEGQFPERDPDLQTFPFFETDKEGFLALGSNESLRPNPAWPTGFREAEEIRDLVTKALAPRFVLFVARERGSGKGSAAPESSGDSGGSGGPSSRKTMSKGAAGPNSETEGSS